MFLFWALFNFANVIFLLFRSIDERGSVSGQSSCSVSFHAGLSICLRARIMHVFGTDGIVPALATVAPLDSSLAAQAKGVPMIRLFGTRTNLQCLIIFRVYRLLVTITVFYCCCTIPRRSWQNASTNWKVQRVRKLFCWTVFTCWKPKMAPSSRKGRLEVGAGKS